MRYLCAIELIDGTFIHLISESSQTICREAKFSVLLQRRSRRVFPSPFNLNICIINCTTETGGIQREKAALNPLVSS